MTSKPALTDQVDFDSDDFGYAEIVQWALSSTGGALPECSARPFAIWLDADWNSFEGDEDVPLTYLDVLNGALDTWTGGRNIVVTDSLKASYTAASKAHADLYAGVDDPDAPEDNGWRRGPGPMKLADFFADLSGTGILVWLKDDSK